MKENNDPIGKKQIREWILSNSNLFKELMSEISDDMFGPMAGIPVLPSHTKEARDRWLEEYGAIFNKGDVYMYKHIYSSIERIRLLPDLGDISLFQLYFSYSIKRKYADMEITYSAWKKEHPGWYDEVVKGNEDIFWDQFMEGKLSLTCDILYDGKYLDDMELTYENETGVKTRIPTHFNIGRPCPPKCPKPPRSLGEQVDEDFFS